MREVGKRAGRKSFDNPFGKLLWLDLYAPHFREVRRRQWGWTGVSFPVMYENVLRTLTPEHGLRKDTLYSTYHGAEQKKRTLKLRGSATVPEPTANTQFCGRTSRVLDLGTSHIRRVSPFSSFVFDTLPSILFFQLLSLLVLLALSPTNPTGNHVAEVPRVGPGTGRLGSGPDHLGW